MKSKFILEFIARDDDNILNFHEFLNRVERLPPSLTFFRTLALSYTAVREIQLDRNNGSCLHRKSKSIARTKATNSAHNEARSAAKEAY